MATIFHKIRANIKRQSLVEGVEHVTVDPQGNKKAVRLHLHPSKGPCILYINGQHILVVRHGEAKLLRVWMQELKKAYKPGQEATPAGLRAVMKKTAQRMHEMYPNVKDYQKRFEGDLGFMQKVIFEVAEGKQPKEIADLVPMTMEEYSVHMTAPFRMDLAVMPMRIDGKWSCNNSCLDCYAMTGKAMQVTSGELLTTKQWKKVIDILWKAGTSQLSFTGGEATEREDLPEIIAHAKEFTTRLNTNARRLTPEFCKRLVAAELDVIQATVFSNDGAIHNKLAGAKGAWDETIQGIRNAVSVGLEVSVNSPLMAENVNGLSETIKYLNEQLGIRYFTCSGLLPAGGALTLYATGRDAAQETLYKELARAKTLANQMNLELDFTSPGCLSDSQLKSLGITPPVCGACLGNMAVAPDGEVVPCQSSVFSKKALGNILTRPWKQIWNDPMCKRIRAQAANKNECPLATEVK